MQYLDDLLEGLLVVVAAIAADDERGVGLVGAQVAQLVEGEEERLHPVLEVVLRGELAHLLAQARRARLLARDGARGHRTYFQRRHASLVSGNSVSMVTGGVVSPSGVVYDENDEAGWVVVGS